MPVCNGSNVLASHNEFLFRDSFRLLYLACLSFFFSVFGMHISMLFDKIIVLTHILILHIRKCRS